MLVQTNDHVPYIVTPEYKYHVHSYYNLFCNAIIKCSVYIPILYSILHNTLAINVYVLVTAYMA